MTGGASGEMVIVAGIGHGNTSSNPGLIAFQEEKETSGKYITFG